MTERPVRRFPPVTLVSEKRERDGVASPLDTTAKREERWPDDWQPQVGDVCRAKVGAPARYLGNGWCLFVECPERRLVMAPALPPCGSEERFPLPTDRQVQEMSR